jgi:hypothetical protein
MDFVIFKATDDQLREIATLVLELGRPANVAIHPGDYPLPTLPDYGLLLRRVRNGVYSFLFADAIPWRYTKLHRRFSHAIEILDAVSIVPDECITHAEWRVTVRKEREDWNAGIRTKSMGHLHICVPYRK